jgi:hypothetical protein
MTLGGSATARHDAAGEKGGKAEVHVIFSARIILAYTLTLAVPVAGILASFLVGWCASRFVLTVTQNSDYAAVCFGAGMLLTGGAFIYWVWVPLRPAIKRLGEKPN